MSGSIPKTEQLAHHKLSISIIENRDRSWGRKKALNMAVEAAFKDLMRLAAQICTTPIAQIHWRKRDGSWLRVQPNNSAEPIFAPDIGFCLCTIEQSGLFIVPDTLQDPRFSHHPLVVNPPAIRFYAGVPLRTADGYLWGTLCIMDDQPRSLTDPQKDGLEIIARQAIALLESGVKDPELQHSEQQFVPQIQQSNGDKNITSRLLETLLPQTFNLMAIVRSSDQGFLYVNPSCCEALGYTEAEFSHLSWGNILHPDCGEDCWQLPQLLISKQTLENVELILLTKEGDRLFCQGKIFCHWQDGNPCSICVILQDITAQKKAEAKYRQIFENATQGLFQATLSGGYTTVNLALAKIYGYDSPQQFLASVSNGAELYVNPDHWADCIKKLTVEGRICCEAEVKRRDGKKIWIEETFELLCDLHNHPIGVEGFVDDITSRKQAETTLQTTRDQLQAVLDAVPGTVSLISSNFRYLGANRHLAATYNLPPEEFVGREVGFRESKFGQFVREFFANQTEEASIEIDTKVNDAFHSDMVIAKKWQGNEAAVFVGIDITERKRAEAALQAELMEAADYVQSLLPIPAIEPVRIDSRFIPSQQLGGDCFDYYWLDDDHLAIYLLDVSGHGSRAALLSVSVLNFLRSRFLPSTNFYEPNQVLNALNQAFQMDRQRNMYFTIWYGVYNRSTRSLLYSCAGHPPAMLITKNPENLVEVKQLSTSGCIPIGMFPQAKYINDSCQIEPASNLYIFSDGIYEIPLPNGEIWQLDNFIQVLADYTEKNQCSLENILQAVRSLNFDDAFNDDVSLLHFAFD